MPDIERIESEDTGALVWVVVGVVVAGVALLTVFAWYLITGLLESDEDASQDVAGSSVSTTSTAVPTTTTTEPAMTTTTEPPATTTSVVQSIRWDYTLPEDLPALTVVDPGQPPREELIYTPEVGATLTMISRSQTAIEQSVDGQQTLAFASDVATEVTVTVVAVDEAGITVESVFGASTVETADSQTATALNATYAQLEGLAVYSLLSPRGEVLAVSSEEQPGELIDLARILIPSAPPLPAEPVGEGARWEVVSAIDSAGVELIQTTQVYLLELDGPSLTIETDTAQSLGPGGLIIPGIEIADVDLSTAGTGTVIWDLTSVVPIEAFGTVDQALTATLTVDDGEGTFYQSSSISLDWARAPGPGVFDLWEVGELRLVGDATRFVSCLRVTPSRNRLQAGAAWLTAKQPVADGFETSFRFRISGVEQNPGDGFAFVIQNSSESALGRDGVASGIGYKGMRNSVAIEFDTTHHDYERDPNGNHIAVHTLGPEPNTPHRSALVGFATPRVELWTGRIHTVMIEYSPGVLSVFLDDLENPILEVELNLTKRLRLDDGQAWVGFSASTEPGFRANHDILDWTFSPRP